MKESDEPLKFLSLGENRKIAYRQLKGTKPPGIIYLSGFMSNMNGQKATLLRNFCKENGHPFLRFDYESVGESPGDFREMHIGLWKDDAMAALDQLTTGPQLLVGSSMGAWLMFLIAPERQQRIHSLLGVSSAINFTENFYKSYPKEIRSKIDAGESVTISGPYGDYRVTKTFIFESKTVNLRTDVPLSIDCPVRLIHAIPDWASPCETTILLTKLIKSKDVEVVMRKNADHRMSDESSLALLLEKLRELTSYHVDH